MSTLYVVVVLVTAGINAAVAVADVLKAKLVVATSTEVGVPESWLPGLAALKISGAVGLLAGLAGYHLLGIAAAAGLVLFFTVAIAAHIRARVFHNIYFPAFFWSLAAATLVLTIHQ